MRGIDSIIIIVAVAIIVTIIVTIILPYLMHTHAYIHACMPLISAFGNKIPRGGRVVCLPDVVWPELNLSDLCRLVDNARF